MGGRNPKSIKRMDETMNEEQPRPLTVSELASQAKSAIGSPMEQHLQKLIDLERSKVDLLKGIKLGTKSGTVAKLTTSDLLSAGIEIVNDKIDYNKLSKPQKEALDRALSTMFLEKSIDILSKGLTDEKIQKASLRDITFASALMLEKSRLLSGDSTENVSVTATVGDLVNKANSRIEIEIPVAADIIDVSPTT